MGKPDALIKHYLRKNDIFADAFNYYLFEGKQVIRSEDLKEKDPTELSTIEKQGKAYVSQRYRDVLKQCVVKQHDSATLVLLGIEGQRHVDFSMPVRNGLYDFQNYKDQVDAIKSDHRKSKDLEGFEFISGMKKGDKITPVITLCICFDKNRWDGPRSLSEMFGDINPKLRPFVNDYKLHLITPDEIEDFTKFSSELGKVMEMIHCSDDKEKMRELIGQKERYGCIDRETVVMIKELTNTPLVVEEKEGGKADMCKAIDEIIQEEVDKAKEEWSKSDRDKNELIKDQKNQLADKDELIAEKDAEIRRLKAMLASAQ